MIERAPGRAAPFSIRQMGIYLVVDTQAGLVLLWDKKTTLFLRLEPKFKVRPWMRAAELETSRQEDGGRQRDREGEGWQFCPKSHEARWLSAPVHSAEHWPSLQEILPHKASSCAWDPLRDSPLGAG